MQDDEEKKKDPPDNDRSFEKLCKVIELILKALEILVNLING